MTIGIIVAMSKELNLLLPLLNEPSCNSIDGFKFHIGKIGDKKIPKKALEELTKNKLNIELTSINGYEEFEKNFYSEKYNCYYLQHGDTNYQAVEFISGEKNNDGTYTFVYNGYSHVTYKESQFKLNCYVNDNVYTIISNLPIN